MAANAALAVSRTTLYAIKIATWTERIIGIAFLGGMLVGGPIFGANSAVQSCLTSKELFNTMKVNYMKTLKEYTEILSNSKFDQLAEYGEKLELEYQENSLKMQEINNKNRQNLMSIQIISISLLSLLLILFIVKYYVFSKKLV